MLLLVRKRCDDVTCGERGEKRERKLVCGRVGVVWVCMDVAVNQPKADNDLLMC